MNVTIIEDKSGFCRFEACISIHDQEALGETTEEALRTAVARKGYRVLSWETSIVHKPDQTCWLVTGRAELITH